MTARKRLARLAAATALPSILFGCGEPAVSYSKEVQPILQTHCVECHTGTGAGITKTGLDMGSHEGLMKGTKFGPVIKPGDSLSSTLVLLIEGKADPSINMPHGGREPMPQTQIAVIRTWVDQGAKNN